MLPELWPDVELWPELELCPLIESGVLEGLDD
jgi:hypothetical protein